METEKNLKKFVVEKTPSNLPQIPSNPQIPNPQSPISNLQAPNSNPQPPSPQQVPIPKKNDKEERERERKRKYNEERKKKKEEDKKKKEEKLKKLHDNQKILREEQKILKKNRESLNRFYEKIYGEDGENEAENQEVAPVPEFANKKGGKIMVFGGERASAEEEKKEKKEEEKEKKRKFMAAKRGLDLEFLLTYYENLRNKEIKIQEKKKEEEENPEKLWGYHQKIEEIGEKYNNKIKEFIRENRPGLNLKYSFSYPEELPPYESPEETRRAFFSKLFEGKKRAPETPIEFILDADRAKRGKKREANKKYYEAHKKTEGDFYKASGALADFFSSQCKKKEKEVLEEEEEVPEKVPEEEEALEEAEEVEEEAEEIEEEAEEDDDGIEDLGALEKKKKKINDLLALYWDNKKKVESLLKKKAKILKKIREMRSKEDL